MGGGGSCEWRCNICEDVKTYKSFYARVKVHILHEGVKGVDVCAHTKNPEVRGTFEKEHNDAPKLKDQRSKVGMGNNPHMGVRNESRIAHEARKRRVVQLEEEIFKPATISKDSRLLKMLNNQGREDVESRVARAIFACGIPFNVAWSPYW
jgi:hypothetical protein